MLRKRQEQGDCVAARGLFHSTATVDAGSLHELHMIRNSFIVTAMLARPICSMDRSTLQLSDLLIENPTDLDKK